MFLSESGDAFRNIAKYLIYIFVATFPFILYQGFLFAGTSTRALHLELLVEVLGVLIAIFAFKKEANLSFKKSPITISLFIFFLSLVAASIFGVDFATSFWSKVTRTTGLFYFFHLGIFFLLLLGLFRDEAEFRKLLRVFIVSGVIFALASVFANNGLDLILKKIPWGGLAFANTTFAGMYVYAVFMSSVYYVFSSESGKWWHRLLPLIFVITPFFLDYNVILGKRVSNGFFDFIGAAQSSTLALVFSVSFLVAAMFVSKIRSQKTRRVIIWAGSVIGLFLVIFSANSLLSQGGLVNRVYLSQGTGARPLVWSLSEKAVKERPVLGYGLDNFDQPFEKYYDNRIMEPQNGGEAWFDRGHNIIVDQTIETGYLGLLIYLLTYLSIIASMIYVLLKSKGRKNHIGALVVIGYFLGHFIELQTAFDTTISYVPLVIMAAFATVLFDRTYAENHSDKDEILLPAWGKNLTAFFIILALGAAFIFGTIPIVKSQIANGNARRIGSSEKRIPIYIPLLNSPIDKAGVLNRTVIDIQRGISIAPEVLDSVEKREGFKKEFELFTVAYEEHLASHPDEYRTRLDLANLYIYQRLFEVDDLDKAHTVLAEAEKLVSQAPQAYWMDAVAYLYQRKFSEARAAAKEGYDLNPNIEESQRLVKYIDDSIKTFPEINLYNFKSI